MQTLHISRQELHTRGGVLDRMLDSLFDTAILVDTDCRILYISASSFPDPSQRAAVVGQHISVLDQLSPFEEVLRTGQPRPDLFLELHGRPCISSLFPVLDGERVIGVVGTITVRNLGRLKKVLSQLSDQAAGFRGLYQDLARVDSGYRLEDFVGESPRVADLLDKARKAAHSGESVLILGETGTGKEIIASGIHAERHGGRPLPYVTINCTAIPEQLLESELFGHEKGAFTGATEARMGKFQLAGDGDILLDEIGDMDLQMQSKLLRVLESREFERVGGREIIPLRAGIIASTNQNLLAMSERRAFRADLYYRLSTIELYLPPLRARPEDIPLLIDRLCAQKGGRLRLTSQAMEYLQRYTWPGNVRQLKNLVGRWLVFYDGVQITGRHVVDELTIGQRSYNEAFGVTDPLAGTASPSGPASAPPPPWPTRSAPPWSRPWPMPGATGRWPPGCWASPAPPSIRSWSVSACPELKRGPRISWIRGPRFACYLVCSPSGIMPKFWKGSRTHTARPSTYRSSTVPRVTSRLSLEWLRLSPMTKMEPSGTSIWVWFS